MTELKLELTALAARHIAEEGLSYAQAKRKAAKQVGVAEHHAAMPDNASIEAALREYQTLYQADTQPYELLHLRQLALKWMQHLQRLPGLELPCPVLAVGAVVNGTASEHSPIYLYVYTDEFKHFEMALLNHNIELTPTQHTIESQTCEVLVAQDQGVPIILVMRSPSQYSPPKPVNKGEYAQKANDQQLFAMIKHSQF